MTAQESKIPGTIFIGKWTPKVLFALEGRPHRHGELRRRLRGVSQRMLTRTVRDLESTGLVSRRETRSRIVAVEYSLTDLGRTLIAPLSGMCRWANLYGRYVLADVHFTASNSPAPPEQRPAVVQSRRGVK